MKREPYAMRGSCGKKALRGQQKSNGYNGENEVT